MKHLTDHTAARQTSLFRQIDWFTTLIPFLCILALCAWFVISPESSTNTISAIRNFLGDEMGSYYLIIGLGVFVCSLYIAFSRFGKIRLGETDKPLYSGFQWGSMIFTAGLAADILFYSCCEWILYASDPHTAEMGTLHEWAATYPLFHWGPIAWSFYIVLAVAFGFMIHVRGRDKQKFSEACRPILGKLVDGWCGKLIDLLAVIALLAGTATTFSVSCPLLSAAISQVFHIPNTVVLTVLLLIVIAFVYTMTVWFGMKGVARLASVCAYLFFFLLAYVLFGGGECRYILETGFSSVGSLIQNFIGMATWTDPLRENSFVQNWSIFYWAYWMAWCIATPFFIGVISKGRTIKNTVLGAYGYGLAGSFTSFIVLGNYGLAQQMKGNINAIEMLNEGQPVTDVILTILNTLPGANFVILVLVVTMISFYATTFDALTMVVSCYSYKHLRSDEVSDKRVRTFWAVLFILFPIALIFRENSMSNLQSVAIIAAFPIGIIICIIVAGFFKDAKQYLDEKK